MGYRGQCLINSEEKNVFWKRQIREGGAEEKAERKMSWGKVDGKIL